MWGFASDYPMTHALLSFLNVTQAYASLWGFKVTTHHTNPYPFDTEGHHMWVSVATDTPTHSSSTAQAASYWCVLTAVGQALWAPGTDETLWGSKF